MKKFFGYVVWFRSSVLEGFVLPSSFFIGHHNFQERERMSTKSVLEYRVQLGFIYIFVDVLVYPLPCIFFSLL